VGRLEEIPQDIGLRVVLEGKYIAIFRRGAKVWAVGDSCPHMGASLSEGYLDGQSVVCPWHSWVFDLESGCSAYDEDAKLEVYPVSVLEGEVHVEVGAGVAEGAPCPTGEGGEPGPPEDS
jgi:nitrite reductase (NADH) small subunit/3-phenylpropionate/trans-cinnamate dioxygenase ferredoxin subunit